MDGSDIGLGLDIDALIIENRNNIWKDKITLSQQRRRSSNTSNNVQFNNVSTSSDIAENKSLLDSYTDWLEDTESSSTHTLYKSPEAFETCVTPTNVVPSDRREKKKSPLTSKGVESSLDGIFCKEKTSNELVMATMVRYGEYSPLNPNLLSPGKSLLGLGEYEEKRRQLMNRKKQEYREYLSQARSMASSREIKTSPKRFLDETKEVQQLEIVSDPTINSSRNKQYTNVATNTTPKHVQVADVIHNMNKVVDKSVATNTTPKHIQAAAVIENNNKVIETSFASNIDENVIDNIAHRCATYLSPRERKQADLQASDVHSPNFLSHSNNNNPVEMSSLPLQSVNNRRDAYKEELRKQIAQKQQIDAELREKEKKEDEAIARRVEEQQERMKLEYLKEQTLNADKQQRFRQIEEFRRRQDDLRKVVAVVPVNNNLSRETTDLKHNQQTVQVSSDTWLESLPIRPPGDPTNHHASRPTVNHHQSRRLQIKADKNVLSGCNSVNNFEDSLPIPVFRAKSPVIPAARRTVEMGPSVGQSANSKAMQMLEAKWQIPAVQKNNLVRPTRLSSDEATGSQKSVLTQLGAFRRQLQLEQMQMEEKLKEKKSINTTSISII